MGRAETIVEIWTTALSGKARDFSYKGALLERSPWPGPLLKTPFHLLKLHAGLQAGLVDCEGFF